jgi:hypothetical protein
VLRSAKQTKYVKIQKERKKETEPRRKINRVEKYRKTEQEA